MKYPKFLDKDSTIGVTALSSGVGEKIDSFKLSSSNLKKNFNVVHTANVRSSSEPSSTSLERVRQLNSLVNDKNIDMVMCAAGGDFLIETIPLIDFEKIKNNVKWFMGYSDPTSLLYIITTKLDIATMYGVNAGSFDQTKLHESLLNSIEIMKGNLIKQNSFSMYEKEKNDEIDGYQLTEKDIWKCINTSKVDVSGRIIGGCIDSLRDIIGTKYDNTLKFIEKYKSDGTIWYFDNFSMSSEDFYRCLFQMNEIGYFKYTKCVVVGRVLFPSSCTDLTYSEALKKIFKNIPVVYDADIGHVNPKMTIINGSIATIKVSDGKGSITFCLK